MSKKKKFRLQAHKKAQILRQLQQDSAITSPVSSVISAQPTESISSPVNDATSKKILYTPITPIEDVRRDIKKIGVVVGILAVLLIITVIVDQKYNYSLVIGQKIAKGLGI